jgi:hypothetical protein
VSERVVRLVLLVALALALSALAPRLAGLRLPGNHQGFEPAQPIAFSHRLHAGELQVQCLYCHSGAERSRHAGIPAASTCMNCHRFVTAPRSQVRAEEKAAESAGRRPRRVVSAELRKLYDALALDDRRQRLQPAAGRPGRPIEWVRIHQVPDFVAFDHRPHIAAGVACQSCHGPVETMERVRQVESLSMGWCLACHRAGVPAAGGAGPRRPRRMVRASTDCAVCHY